MSDPDRRPPSDDEPTVAIDIDHVAELARLTVRPEDREALQADLERLLAFVAQLHQVDVDGSEPMLRPNTIDDALRDDVRRPGLADALAELGAEHEDGRLKVPRTVDKDS